MTKQEDNKAFKAKWIPFGMSLKNRADAHGIDWRKMSFENYIAAIQAAEKMGTARRSARCVMRYGKKSKRRPTKWTAD